MVIVAAMILAVGMGWFLAKRHSERPSGIPGIPFHPEIDGHRVVAHLYFGDGPGRYLRSEQRTVVRPEAAAAYARVLVDLLIKGPLEGGSRTLPDTARVRAVYVGGDGVAYVDFFKDAFERHPGGVGSELMTLFSVVNTLVLNIEEIRSVKLLIGGREAATLAGHVDISPAYRAAMLWVR